MSKGIPVNFDMGCNIPINVVYNGVEIPLSAQAMAQIRKEIQTYTGPLNNQLVTLEAYTAAIEESLNSKVSTAEAIAGLYTIYGKRKFAAKDELYQEFEDGSECVFRGGYYPNDLKDFEQGDRRIVMYGKKGTFSVDMAEDRGDTPEDKHVVNRKFVEDNYVKRVNPNEIGRSYVYRTYNHGGGKYTYDTVKATPASDQYTLMERDSGGRSSVEAPTAEKHIANKAYVDATVKEAKELILGSEALNDTLDTIKEIQDVLLTNDRIEGTGTSIIETVLDHQKKIYARLNLTDGPNEGAIQQVADGVADGFDFTGKNPNAIELAQTMGIEFNGMLPYGAQGKYSVALGGLSLAAGKRALAEGSTTVAAADHSHAEGINSVTLGIGAHAEGGSTTAAGEHSHTEGYNTLTRAKGAHAEGGSTRATAVYAHAEGGDTEASSSYAHAQGYKTKAKGLASHAGGEGTIAGYNYQTVIGYYNYNKSSNIFEIGHGSEDNPFNVFEVTREGAAIAGKQTVSTDSELVLTTKSYVDALEARIKILEENGGGGNVNEEQVRDLIEEIILGGKW